MGKKTKSAPGYLIVYAIIAACAVFPVYAQNIQLVPNGACSLAWDTTQCFTLVSRTITVGKEVTSLGDLYKFCTQVKVIEHGNPARIVLVIDNSGSMCRGNGAGGPATDPTNMRNLAANDFADSVAKKCPACEIGVIIYKDDNTARDSGSKTVVYRLNPLNVAVAGNIALIHNAINSNPCGNHGAAATHKTTTTYSGIALDTAVQNMIDLGYDSLLAKQMTRHIIMLTDGDWQTPVANDIYTQYVVNYPGRLFPTIHGVFMGPGTQFDLSNLDTATKLSTRNPPPNNVAGKFFPGTTPLTIVATLDSLVNTIVTTSVFGLNLVTFTNTTVNPPDSRTATIFFNTGSLNQYTVRVPAFTLQYGTNTFIITEVSSDSSGVKTTVYDTLTIIRNTSSGLGKDSLFTLQCGTDSIQISIGCKPSTLLIPAFDTVTAKVVQPQDVAKFTPNDILLRAFIPFPDNDNNTIALFHLDNNIVNSVQNGTPGNGTVTYSSTNAAFNSCISGGSFSTQLSSSVSDNFTVECWIKPPSTNQASTIISGSGFSFGITADGYLSATIGNTSIATNHVIDKSVWQCVAVARSGGNANIYINGIPMGTAKSAGGALSGALTINAVAGGLLDEVRISAMVRPQQIQGKTTLLIPLADQLLWNINNVQTTGQTAKLPFTMWQGTPAGQVQFLFSSPLPGPMIINFFDTVSSPVSFMWSKNGDPVFFSTTGLAVSATLRDTSHEGHLDMIDLKWTDNSTIKTPLPSINQLVLATVIVTLDGKVDSLHPISLVLDAANKVIHIVLAENKSKARSNYETGWVDGSAKVILSDFKITSDGKPLVVTQVIDGATPIPIASCYNNSSTSDSLWITFSEPLSHDTSASRDNMLRYTDTLTPPQRLMQLNPSFGARVGDKMLFVYSVNGGTHIIVPYTYRIGETFNIGPNAPTVEISYCSNNKLIDIINVGPNPVSQINPPSITITTPTGQTITKNGVKIQVVLTRPIIGPNSKPELEGFLTIFDAVGNVILDNEPLLPEAGKPRNLSVVWNCKNLRGSVVGNGTYLSRIKVRNITSNYTELADRPPVIGVKKEK